MKFLLTNDDGVDAPGIQTLWQVASQLGETQVVAPHLPVSGASHQATTDVALRVADYQPGQLSVTGTPVDCVRIALVQLQSDCDWVLSGINDGGNLGVDTLMSGTVAAAREAALLGRKAIAISQFRRRQLTFEWSWAARQVARVLPHLMRRPLPPRAFWNVNLPQEPDYATVDPDMAFCPLDPHPLPVHYDYVDGGYYYRGNYQGRQRKLGADVDACFGGRISVSLITLD